MAQKAPSDYTAREALIAYGYARDDSTGFYVKNSPAPTQIWRYAENRGWERFDPLTSAMPIVVPDDLKEDIYPYGIADDEAPEGYVKVPYGQLPRFADVGGLNPTKHADCFEWIWPETAVKEIYAYVNTEDREYERIDGELHAISRK